MYNQEQLAAIAAALTILQQQQQQQQQQHQALLDHYQTQLQHHQQSDLHHIASLPPKPHQSVADQLPRPSQLLHQHHQQLPSPPTQSQQQQHQQQSHQHHQQQQQQQQQQHHHQHHLQHQLNHQQHPQEQRPALTPTPTTAPKQTLPISYSAIVAKSAGITPKGASNNLNNQNNGSNITSSNNGINAVASSISNNLNGNIANVNNIVSLGKSTNLAAACNNTFGGLQNNISIDSPSPFCANNSIAKELINITNNLQSNGTLDQPSLRANQLSSTDYILRNSLNNHIASSTNNDIFNTNLSGSSLGHNNGSLLKQNNNISNLLAFEPTLNYTTDHSTSPAQQLFNQAQNSIHHNQLLPSIQHQSHHHLNSTSIISTTTNSRSNSIQKNPPPHGTATNLLGFMGLYVGNLSPDLTKEQLEKIFSKYGEPVKAHRLIRSPVAFIKYENTESPRAAIDDLYGHLLPQYTLNQDQPLKLHFDRNDAQLKANYRPTELPKDDNGECYGWRTTVCRRGKNCPKKHIPINRGIDFQMWMIKSTSAPTTSS